MNLETVLDHLFDADWLEWITRYVNAGGNINRQSSLGGRTLLHFAADSSNLMMIEWLVDHGASLDAKDYLGWTPLLNALDTDIDGCIQREDELNMPTFCLLLKLGADITAESIDGYSVDSIAESYGGNVVAIVQTTIKQYLSIHG